MNHRSWEQLIKPYKIEFDTEESPGRLGTVTVEPLEKGFGVTLGNALRRVLLSSLQGTAVTSVKINGTLLEFSSIPGVAEDVTDIILNVKALELKLSGGEVPQKFTISAQGPCVVTAGMIEGGSQLEVLNPQQVICTISERTSFSMDLFVGRGKGYVPAVTNASHMRQLGEIAIDAVFNPVKRVSYTVESTRIAQSTDYDRLCLTVETNGSITPQDAVSTAAVILQDQLKKFVSFDVQDEATEVTTPRPESMAHSHGSFPPIFFKGVKELDLGVRCLNCLKSEGVVYVGDLVNKTEADLLRTPNFGRKSLSDINNALGQLGLSLGMDFPGWPPENIQKYLADQEELERE